MYEVGFATRLGLIGNNRLDRLEALTSLQDLAALPIKALEPLLGERSLGGNIK